MTACVQPDLFHPKLCQFIIGENKICILNEWTLLRMFLCKCYRGGVYVIVAGAVKTKCLSLHVVTNNKVTVSFVRKWWRIFSNICLVSRFQEMRLKFRYNFYLSSNGITVSLSMLDRLKLIYASREKHWNYEQIIIFIYSLGNLGFINWVDNVN